MNFLTKNHIWAVISKPKQQHVGNISLIYEPLLPQVFLWLFRCPHQQYVGLQDQHPEFVHLWLVLFSHWSLVEDVPWAIKGIRVCMGQTRVQPLSRCGLLLRRSSLLEEPRYLARVGLDFVCFLPSFWNISPFAPSGFGPFTFVTIPWLQVVAFFIFLQLRTFLRLAFKGSKCYFKSVCVVMATF